jgi:arylamine N-acetyltransferase
MEPPEHVFFDHFGILPGTGRDTLFRVSECFSRIPWENLTKFLLKAGGRERLRMPGEVFEGFVRFGTGGTCYSLTEALSGVVSACGWRTRPLTGHMRHGRNIHCALLAEGPGGVYLLDPGFVVPRPVPLEPGGGTLDLRDRSLEWVRREGGWDLFTREGDSPAQWRYRLEDRILSRGEFLAYWRRSFDAPGLNSLHINLSLEDRRLSAHNGNLRISCGGGRENVKLSAGYGEAVAGLFGMSSTVAEEAWRELARLRSGRVERAAT